VRLTCDRWCLPHLSMLPCMTRVQCGVHLLGPRCNACHTHAVWCAPRRCWHWRCYTTVVSLSATSRCVRVMRPATSVSHLPATVTCHICLPQLLVLWHGCSCQKALVHYPSWVWETVAASHLLLTPSSAIKRLPLPPLLVNGPSHLPGLQHMPPSFCACARMRAVHGRFPEVLYMPCAVPAARRAAHHAAALRSTCCKACCTPRCCPAQHLLQDVLHTTLLPCAVPAARRAAHYAAAPRSTCCKACCTPRCCPAQYLLQDMLHTTLLASCMGLTEPARKLGLRRPPARVLCMAVILPVLAQVRPARARCALA